MNDTIFEDYFDAQFKSLNLKLKEIETNIQGIVSSFMLNPEKSRAYWAAKQKAIDEQFSDLSFAFEEWAQIEIPKTYAQDLKNLFARINNIRGFQATAALNFKELLASNASRNIMQALYIDAIESYNGALAYGKSNVMKLLRMTQQTILTESLVNVTVAEGFVGGDLDKAITALFGQFAGQLSGMVKDKQFVQAGKMKYKPSYYAELVARTKFHDAHTFATLAQCQNYDTDLVQVSSHNTKTPICLPHEGVVYSISGRNKDFPPLDSAPPFHPNCLHLLFPTFAGAMKVQGNYESLSKHSLEGVVA